MSQPIDVRRAWDAIDAHLTMLGTQTVRLEDAVGRVLRRDIAADRDLPPFDRSAMDGFAVQAAALGALPVRCTVAGESVPGAPFRATVPAGHAVRIMTGAALPAGCDAVVPVEDTSGFAAPRVEIRRAVVPGANVVRGGTERRAGELLLAAGHRLREVDAGVLAMVGSAALEVGARPRVAVLSTGNELVPHAAVPGPDHIRNSNGPMLAALAKRWSAGVELLGPARDEPADLARYVVRGLTADVMLVTGGVSMGVYDYVAAALEAQGVRFVFRHVALQPGKPTAFGTHARGAVFALPGNPVSALTTFRLFVAPALRRLQGESDTRPRWQPLPAAFAWERRHAKWLLLPGRRAGGKVERVEYAGSGDLAAFARADCQIVLPPERNRVVPGETVDVWALG